MTGCKVYYSGHGDTPGPGFRLESSRASLAACEAQDTRGCGFEVLARATLAGCTADSTGIGQAGTDRYSVRFYVGASSVAIQGSAFQRADGGAKKLDAAGMRYSLGLADGIDFLLADIVAGHKQPQPYQGTVLGTPGSRSRVTVLG